MNISNNKYIENFGHRSAKIGTTINQLMFHIPIGNFLLFLEMLSQKWHLNFCQVNYLYIQ